MLLGQCHAAWHCHNTLLMSYCFATVMLFFPLSGYIFPTVMLVCHSCCSVTVVVPCQSCCFPVSSYSATMILLAAVIQRFHCWTALSVSCYFATLILLYHCHVTLLQSCSLTLSCCPATLTAAWLLMLLLGPCHNALPIMLPATFMLL